MNKKFHLFAICFLFCLFESQVFSRQTREYRPKQNENLAFDDHNISQEYYPNFTNNPLLTEDMKGQMRPFLLPLDHSTKPVLDKIFNSNGVIENEDSLRAAGFIIAFSQPRSLIRVVRHPELPGFLVKLFPNTETKMLSSGWAQLKRRCLVAREIREIIVRKNLFHFEVPDKWLYPLPQNLTGKRTQPLVLLVKDMDILGYAESKRGWRKCTEKTVFDQLYQIMARGHGSTFLPGNLPLTRRGTFAFVDTEFGKRKMHLSRIYKYISLPMRRYCHSLSSSCPPLD